ncbi:hypothetical protein ACEWY4_009403 [Coilia grayii]|uniref:Uncharacterized protein n=1 Tax=Coilia grayii TaxID=363190 RepID=A0ABD1K6D9_9TELE
MCQVCRRVNRRERSPCTATRNAVCGECLPGFYSKRRLDGLQDLECMPCGPPPFQNALCSSRSSGVDVEKVWSLEATPQPSTAVTASICVALVAMVTLLSVTLSMYRRYTSLRKCLKGLRCLPSPSSNQDDKESPPVSTETQCTLTQEAQSSGTWPWNMMPREASMEKGSATTEVDGGFPLMPTVLCVPADCLPCPLRQSFCSECSSGFASQPPSGLPTPLPTSGEPAAPAFSTRGHHCAMERGSGPPGRQRHCPVECTELDVHESFHLLGAELQHASTGPGSEAGLPRGGEEPSLDLYSSTPPDISREPRACSEVGRPSGTEEATYIVYVYSVLYSVHSTLLGVPLRALPEPLVGRLAHRLDPVFPGVQSYQQVAQCLGVPAGTARGLQGFEHVFHYLSSCTLLTVPDLLTALHRLQRLDALSLLCEHCWTAQGLSVSTQTLSAQQE